VPAKVNGRWKLPQGELTLNQVYQTFRGSLKNADGSLPVAGRVHGDQVNFRAGKIQFTARVETDVMEGFARTAGVDSKFRASRIEK
jgi:hypothetical protein